MAELSKEEKKLMLKKWKEQQNRKYILSKSRVQKMFQFVESCLEKQPCDHTLRFTKQWLLEHIPPEKHEAMIEEIVEMGGHCDCEVICNCYENYFV